MLLLMRRKLWNLLEGEKSLVERQILLKRRRVRNRRSLRLCSKLFKKYPKVYISEPDSIPALHSEVAPIAVALTPEPDKAPSESPIKVHVLTPPTSPLTKILTPPPSPIPDAPIPSPPPLTNLAFD